MGEANVILATGQKQTQIFMKYLLSDIKVLERMIEDGIFETGITRIGAEQEMCLIDEHYKPAPINLKVLDEAKNPCLTSELARFNLEANLDPLEFVGNCLSQMEENIVTILNDVRKHAAKYNSDILLSGILPTIRKFDLTIENLTPLDRYKALVQAINKLRGGIYELRLRGTDELILRHDSPLLEACNTGFQVHMQVDPDNFVRMYNISQAIAAPTLAIATNSPMLFGKRLWSETRIALFQQSLDTRHTSEHLRERSPRVTFGTDWLRNSILDIYKEDIARFRVWLSTNSHEDAKEVFEAGNIPKLGALQIHNSTVYRWNRPCYGVGGGKPHLRIENRVLPSGPTVVDEIANTALWLGLMKGYGDQYEDITKVFTFDHANSNFLAASRLGMDTHFRWINGTKLSSHELIEKELIPAAKVGLESANINKDDINKYLDIIAERNETGNTGSHWIMDSYASLIKDGSREEVVTTITASMAKHQLSGIPGHKWPLAAFEDAQDWHPSSLLVEEFMTTDLFTVQKDDILELAVDMLDWNRIRYMPVEDNKGKLVGLITSRLLLRYFGKHRGEEDGKTETVKTVMIDNPITIHPEATIVEAMDVMENNRIGCLPVLKNEKLVGIITEQDFQKITRRLIKRLKKK